MQSFTEVGIILLIGSFVSLLLKKLKQPFIIGYIITGIIIGPYFLNILTGTDSLEFLSKIGITTLLFIVGLHLNPGIVKDLGKVSLITGIGQIVFTSLIGYIISILLGFSPITSFYIALALTFSSTIIILKILTDKGDVDKLYGRISIGFLLVQDIVASLILAILPIFSLNAYGNTAAVLLETFIKISVLSLFLIFFNRRILPKISAFIAGSQELLFTTSLSWSIFVAILFYKAGFSMEIGALVAGISLSTSEFAVEIGSRLKPIRDFFILQFFVLLGAQMHFGNIATLSLPILVFSLFVLIGNPLIVFLLMNLLGYKRKTGFFAGLTVAQISEFSLILISQGVMFGDIPKEIVSLITFVGLITISGSTYMVLYSDKLYKLLKPILVRLEIKKTLQEKTVPNLNIPEILLFGYDRVGDLFVKTINKLNRPYFVIDYNPASIKKLSSNGIPHIYGDASDPEMLEEIDMSKLKLAISTIPDTDTNNLIISQIKKAGNTAIMIVISHQIKDTEALYENGATYVVMPHFLGARYAAHLIRKCGLEKNLYLEQKRKHLEQIFKYEKQQNN